MDPLDKFFQKKIAGLLADSPGKIAVAVSGGADSMALALLCKKHLDDETEIIAITVDHRLRDESADEARQVAKWMDSHNIKHVILTWEGDKKNSNIQDQAREARYRLMTDYCHENKINNLLVAHHMQDQAETVLLRLARGSGVDGLTAMEELSHKNSITILRPLLSVSKEMLVSYLQNNNQQWVEDPSNDNEKYTRVWIRKLISEYENPDILCQRLIKTAQNMSRSRSYIEEKCNEEFAKAVKFEPEGYALLDNKIFKDLHDEAAFRILSKVIKLVGREYYKPRFEKIENLYKNLKSDNVFKGGTLGGCVISYLKDDEYIILREIKDIAPPLPVIKNKTILWDERFTCKVSDISYNNLTIGCLGQENYLKLRNENKEIAELDLQKQIIYTIPAVYSLEKLIAAPHIEYYKKGDLKDKIKIEFIKT